MIELHVVKLPDLIDDKIQAKLFDKIEDERVTRLKRFRFKEDRYRSLISDILSRTLICEKLRIKSKDIKLKKNQHGKPFLQSQELYFNNSHSGDWVLCGISDRDLGVDIEIIKEIDLNIAKRFFHKLEYKELLKKSEKEKMNFFFDLWTLKESYIKADGRGLAVGLDSFRVIFEQECIRAEYLKKLTDYYLKVFNFERDYKVAICTKNICLPGQINIHLFDEITKKFLSY